MSRLLASSLIVAAACGGKNPVTPDAAEPPPDEAPPTPTTIRVTVGDFVGGSYAFQDGDGAWQLAPAPASGVITFDVIGPRYGFARLCPPSRTARVSYFATTETSPTSRCFVAGPPSGNSFVGQITTAQVDAVHQLFHGADSVFFSDTEPAFDYEFPVAGPANDFVAVRQPPSDAPDVLHVERGLAVSGAVTKNLDFGQLAPPVLIAQPVPQDQGNAYTFLQLGDTLAFYDDFLPPFDHAALAVGARQPTDRYDVGVVVDLDAELTSSVSADKVLAVPAAVTAPTTNLLDPLQVTTTGGTTIVFNKVPGMNRNFTFVFTDQPGTGVVLFSDAWLATFTGDVTWHVPDLSTIAQWPTASGLRGTVTSVDIDLSIETGTFPEIGYTFTGYRRGYRVPTFAPIDRIAHRRRVTRATVGQRLAHDRPFDAAHP